MNGQTWRLRAAGITGLTAVLALAAGCGEEALTTGSGNPTLLPEMSIDLAQADGGLTTGAESPGFGDPYFLSFLSDATDREITDDPLTLDSRLADMEARGEIEVKYLRVIWGNMTRGPEADASDVACERTDWTGQATVSDGLLLPVRVLRFERGDAVIPPWKQEDPSRQKVEWISHTCPGKDGIVFRIVVPVAGDETFTRETADTPRDGLTDDDVFTFRTGPLSKSFKLSEIQDVDELVMVDDQNGVSFVGFAREDMDPACARGAMEGAWARVADDERHGGYFRARLATPLGRVFGHVRGRWGVLPEGDRVFVGKIIGRNGEYLGHMRGTWDPSDRPGHGTYHGGWTIEGRAHGAVRGEWRVSDRIDGGGFLRGLWIVDCNRDGDGA